MSAPIIFLAFANDRDNYLHMINRERKNIRRSLRRHNDEGLIKLETEASSSLEDIFEFFQNYPDQCSIFHYGGHAGGSSLQLEANNSAQAAYSEGLAKLLGQQENLQLVFLNGCATQGQVSLLLQNGVKAVIATSVPIQDQMATEFAEQFYNSLASHTSIQKSFAIATAFVATKYKDKESIRIWRDGVFDFFEKNEKEDVLPWGLYCHPDHEEALQWSLPKRIANKQILKTRFDYEKQADVNDILIDIICEELAQYNPDLDQELNKEDLDIPSIKREIVDSFPTPIGEHLRKLFTRSNDPDVPDDMEVFSLARLEQIAMTHRTTVQFICFTLLSQLWDVKHSEKKLEIDQDYIVDFNSFFALNEKNFHSFDYVKLLNTITEIFDAHHIPYFIDELKDVQVEAEKDQDLYGAYIFMNSLYESIIDNAIDKEELESLCLEAEHHLGIVLKSIAFLTKYKLVTIKNIEIIKNRHETPRFRHSQITLNRALTVASTGIAEVGIEFNNFTDNKSVLFIKVKDDKVDEFLNLTPFIIDENALNSNYSSKLFLYAYQGKGNYSYQFLNNLKDEPLGVNLEVYPDIKSQFDRFQAEIFGRDYIPETKPKAKVGGSRFSRKR